jgi:purine nucleosidase
MKLWLDTDPGFDDWMAWALIESMPEMQLLGVSVVAGNAPLRQTLSNALRIKSLHGWTTAVHAGSEGPLSQAQVTAQDVLGDHAMATIERPLPAASAVLASTDAVLALSEALRSNPGEITVLAIGPLTHLAQLLAQSPQAAKQIRQLVIMGGSTDRGNATPAAEFNFLADAQAAHQVFESGVDIRMFGLNVCRQVLVGHEHVARLRAIGSTKAHIFADYLAAYVNIAARRQAVYMSVYDPTPVAWLANPQWFTLQPARVDIELQGRWSTGMSVCELRVPDKALPNAQVAMTAQGPKIMDWMMRQLEQVLTCHH